MHDIDFFQLILMTKVHSKRPNEKKKKAKQSTNQKSKVQTMNDTKNQEAKNWKHTTGTQDRAIQQH